MTLLKKMIKSRSVRDEAKNQAENMTSMEFFKSFDGKDLGVDGYVYWYNALSTKEKQRINALIDALPIKGPYIGHSLASAYIDAHKVSAGRIKELPIQNLVRLRYVVKNDRSGEMVLRATGFVVCTDPQSREQEYPNKLDVVVIRSNGDTYRYNGVKVLKQGDSRYYLNFNGYTSYELDKNLLKKYCKGVYPLGRKLRELPPSEFISLEQLIAKDRDINIHLMHDYESAYFKYGKRNGVDAQI